jgi:uncharacterized OB-fold protein
MVTVSASRRLPFRDFPGAGSSARLRPLVVPDNAPFFKGLQEGQLLLQQCTSCHRLRSPPAPCCPWCFNAAHEWVAAVGEGSVHSWTRYHKAFLSEFAPLLPYAVVAAALVEGPIVYGRLVRDTAMLTIGMALRAVIERWQDGFCSLAFMPKGADQ